ncbi:uncharacterized protein EAF01_008822 [Botrytis porri]|uniref:uncharacterized protein n=1 Tax=Botrytis porri TaxID=87229 RepID=UPI0019004951|nr:uncharacterized protein EAF01_008822 [Botrytis porri]KAF7897856.1 hypothetical protein EAF01_008822 [Botrytis porri]
MAASASSHSNLPSNSFPSPSRLSTHRLSSIPNHNHTPTYANNPHDPLEVLYTLSPPSFHYLPRSVLLPPQILRKGFIETPENNPPLLEGTRMQIMVIPRGVRRVVVHFLVYDPVLKERGENLKALRDVLREEKDGKEKEGKEGPKKLKKKASKILNSQEKRRDFPMERRSMGRFGGADMSLDASVNMDMNGKTRMNQRENFDGMEIEIMEKRHELGMDVQREEDREGEYVVMRRVVKLPRRVWCGRNCKDQFEQLFIRRT